MILLTGNYTYKEINEGVPWHGAIQHIGMAHYTMIMKLECVLIVHITYGKLVMGEMFLAHRTAGSLYRSANQRSQFPLVTSSSADGTNGPVASNFII